MPFDKARAIVRKLKFKNQFDWQKNSKKILEKIGMAKKIPIAPYTFYKSQDWINWGDWLGTGNLLHGQKQFLSYEDAKKIVHSFKFKSKKEWNAFCEKLKSGNKYSKILSVLPQQYYGKKGWKGWGDWLGCNFNSFLSYEYAKKYVQTLTIKSSQQWRIYNKALLPPGIPKSPEQAYKSRGEWVSWGDFLGTGTISRKKQGSKKK